MALQCDERNRSKYPELYTFTASLSDILHGRRALDFVHEQHTRLPEPDNRVVAGQQGLAKSIWSFLVGLTPMQPLVIMA